MTVSTAAYLTLLRVLSDDEVSEWRHAYDRARRVKPSRLAHLEENWRRLVEARLEDGANQEGDCR
jgi:hypothetical protein